MAGLRRANREYRREEAAPSGVTLPTPDVRLTGPEGEPDLGELLGALPLPAALADPLVGPDGTVRDFVAVAVNPAGLRYLHQRSALRRDRTPGRRLPAGDVFPGLVTAELLTDLTRVLRTGEPTPGIEVRWQVRRAGGRVERHTDLLTVHRLGSRLLMVWGTSDLARMARAAQRIARVGWGEWSLLDGVTQSSGGLRDLLGLAAGDPSPTAADLLDRVLPVHQPRLFDALRLLLETRDPVDVELLLRVHRGVHRIRLVAEAVGEDQGPVRGVRGVLQNITELSESRRRVRHQQEEIERQSRRADAEEAVVRRLQDALQPRISARMDEAGLRTAVAYRPTEGLVGGDWYKVRALPGGPALIAVGDARGHGLDAVALMSTLRHALAGIAYTGASVEEMTGWLNEIACDDGPESTATAVIARYFPPSRLLRWVCAGHLPPVLLGDGPPRLLAPAIGLPLGVLPGTGYEAVETVLQPGQTVLLYTDGLVERRDRDIDDRLATLLAVLGEHPPGLPPQSLVDQVVDAMSGPFSEDDATLLALRLAG
ncbi:PP2C family protein-serine/threonine phosphatase [Kitasatospora viridis]|uniref:Stage II sporulation protein E n=1 Tax=Kitasatospora viridis TaxID=281105 RepID=A0A561TT91_9ACTN|nr:PP2C family protein-serine/threonine phosphatase [Kitasatospora viridis]TWF90333.1 stage II sporulation protein E [Kitasatospora viridis]